MTCGTMHLYGYFNWNRVALFVSQINGVAWGWVEEFLTYFSLIELLNLNIPFVITQ